MSTMRPFCMPKWGIEMTEGSVAEWMVGEGDRISKGQVICLIETSKISNEVEAERDGVVLRLVAPAGDAAIPVGALLAVLGDEPAPAEAVAQFVSGFVPAEGGIDKSATATEAEATERPVEAPARIVTNRPISPKALELAESAGIDLAAVEGSGRGGRITHQDIHQHLRPAANPAWRGPAELQPDDRRTFASPLARRLAAIHGIALDSLSGTGPRGRISKHDVLAAVQAAPGPDRDAAFVPVANPARIEPFDKIRKVVARRLTVAKQEIPHFYLRTSVSVVELLDLRKTANLVLGCKASVNDYLVWATAKALARHPEINVQVHGEELHSFAHADVAVAVASPKGLITPVLRQVDRMRIDQLASASAGLIDKARAGRLSYDDLEGGTFTVSNLGMFGVEEFDAIINPPQAAILAVGQVQRVPCELDDGEIGFDSRIGLTLSVDHRAIDGAAGARFLATLKAMIENPETLFG